MAKNKKLNKNKSRDWMIRIAIFGLLGVVLVLALLDYQTKNQAIETSQAWMKMVDDSKADEDKAFVLVKDLQDNIRGTPEVVKEKADDGKTHLVYTWKGIFRKYVVTVESETGGDNSIVDRVHGLGNSQAK